MAVTLIFCFWVNSAMWTFRYTLTFLRNIVSPSLGMKIMIMEAIITPETSVNFYETIQHFIPKDCLNTHRSENLKSHLLSSCLHAVQVNNNNNNNKKDIFLYLQGHKNSKITSPLSAM